MTNKELLEEIRMNRQEVQNLEQKVDKLSREFYIFKGKAFSFIAVISGIFTFIGNYLVKKL